MGDYGAGRSIYNNFMARGTEVVFAKHTPMEIAVDTRTAAPRQTASPTSNKSSRNSLGPLSLCLKSSVLGFVGLRASTAREED
jgi:hypothetical protein